MCYASACNPTCGKCRPKGIIEVVCPECGVICRMTREEYLIYFELPHRKTVFDRKIIERGGVQPPVCETCNAALTETFRAAVSPLPCRKSGVMCGYPCGGRFDQPSANGASCPTVVPVGKYDPAEVDFTRTGNI